MGLTVELHLKTNKSDVVKVLLLISIQVLEMQIPLIRVDLTLGTTWLTSSFNKITTLDTQMRLLTMAKMLGVVKK